MTHLDSPIPPFGPIYFSFSLPVTEDCFLSWVIVYLKSVGTRYGLRIELYPPMSENQIAQLLTKLQGQIRKLQREVSSFKEEGRLGTSSLLGTLRRRGLEPFRRNPAQHLVFPPGFSPEKSEAFYHLFQRYSFRLFLREILIHKGTFRVSQVVRFSTPDTGRKYLKILIELGLAEPAGHSIYCLRHPPPASLGPTLEWFIAEVLKNEFSCPALYGLRCKGSRYGGDYDVVALLEGKLVYMEVKSSPPKNIEGGEVQAFLARFKDLFPHLALFFVDTELRLKDKIIPFFEAEFRAQGFGEDGRAPAVQKIGEEIFFFPPGIYILGSKPSIIKNIASCFRNDFTLSLVREWGPGVLEPLRA